MSMSNQISPDLIDLFVEFFEQEYTDAILEFSENETSFTVDLELLKEFDENAVEGLVNNPDGYIDAMNLALQQHSQSDSKFEDLDSFRIRFENLPDKYYIPIRSIRSEHINKLIGVRGIASKSTRVRPKVKVAEFECNYCGSTTRKIQDGDEISEPSACSNDDCDKRNFKLLPAESETRDYQKVELKESPDETEGGETPETINFKIEGDKTGIVLTGRRVDAIGVLQSKVVQGSTVLMTFLQGNNITLEDEQTNDELTEEDIEKIKEMSQQENILSVLAKSVAPGIKGYEIPKKGVVAQLFSGVDKTAGTSNIRGNIHSLWVGDPGTGKSQVLDYTADLLPNGVSTSGKGSSAAGLTAAVVSDKDFAGEDKYTLKAGALVLADGGIACVDELDKMSDNDRSALHGALEQQQISVNKAGINATLKSRCSMLAAANPKHGRFEDFSENIITQIDLPPALISRFDLIFVIRDELDEEEDKKIADTILSNNIAGEENAQKMNDYEGSGESVDKLPDEDLSDPNPDAISKELFRKYVLYARRNVFPKLTDDARDYIKNEYSSIRQKGDEDTYPITHRKLEAMIRLTEALARVRLSQEATKEDAKRALSIIIHSMRQVGMNEEGEFDTDMVETGQSSTQRDRVRGIEQAIKQIKEEKRSEGADDTTATKEEIIDRVDKKREKVEKEIQKLATQGGLYQPAGAEGYRIT